MLFPSSFSFGDDLFPHDLLPPDLLPRDLLPHDLLLLSQQEVLEPVLFSSKHFPEREEVVGKKKWIELLTVPLILFFVSDPVLLRQLLLMLLLLLLQNKNFPGDDCDDDLDDDQ